MSTKTPAAAVVGEVRAEIARRGTTGTKVATALGMNRASFSNRMNGITEFSLSELFAVCVILDVDPAELFRRAERVAA